MQKRILTIQDVSCVGQCSATVARPIISACGVETAMLPSAVLSTHTAGFTGFTVLSMTEEFPKIIDHWKNEKIRFDGVYTGYILKDQIDLVGRICKELNDGYKIIDPVMADNGSFYYGFDQKFADKMAELCFGADVILPNLSEAAFLLGKKPVIEGYDENYIVCLLKELSAKLSVKRIVLTGVSFEKDKLGVAVFACETQKTDYYFNKRIERNFHGTGDIYSSAFVGAFMNGFSTFESAKIAVDFTVEAMEITIPFADKHPYGVFFESAIKNLTKRIFGGKQ